MSVLPFALINTSVCPKVALCFILAFEEESIVRGEGRLRAENCSFFYIMENRGYAGNVSLELFSIAECWGVKYCRVCRTSGFVALSKSVPLCWPQCATSPPTHFFLLLPSFPYTLEKSCYFLTVDVRTLTQLQPQDVEVDRMRQSKFLT